MEHHLLSCIPGTAWCTTRPSLPPPFSLRQGRRTPEPLFWLLLILVYFSNMYTAATVLLLAVSALGADTEAPVISLELAGSATAHASSNHQSGSTYADMCCNGYKCDTVSDACALPTATAYDHHDGDVTNDIVKVHSIFVESIPGCDPEQADAGSSISESDFDNKITPGSDDYDPFRGEFVVQYDVSDDAGNDAETVTYALIMRDTIAPTYDGTDLTQSSSVGNPETDFNAIPLSDFSDTFDLSYVSATFTHVDTTYVGSGSATTTTTIASSSATCSGTPDTTSEYAVPSSIVINNKLCIATTVDAEVSDYANLFGVDNQDNVNTLTFSYNLVDASPPAIVLPTDETDMVATTECHGGTQYPYVSGATSSDLSCECHTNAATALTWGTGTCNYQCTSAYTAQTTLTPTQTTGAVIITCTAKDYVLKTKSVTATFDIMDTTPPTLTLGITTINFQNHRATNSYGNISSYNTTSGDEAGYSASVQHSAGYLADAADIEDLRNHYTCADECTSVTVSTSWHKADANETCTTIGDHNIEMSIVDTGTYLLKYVCADLNGNTAQKCRTIFNLDHLKPMLEFVNEDNMMGPCFEEVCYGIPAGEGDYIDEGATCSDETDGVISELVEVSGDIVNMQIIGTYWVSYDCTDSAGNIADKITRQVRVYDETCPTCEIPADTATLTLEASFPYSDTPPTCSDNLIFGDTETHTSAPVIKYAAAGSAGVVGVGGEVDVELTGTYIISYHISDMAQNTNFLTAGGVACNTDIAQARTLIVADTMKPIINLVDVPALMEESSSVNGWVLGAVASFVAGIALVSTSARTTTTEVPV